MKGIFKILSFLVVVGFILMPQFGMADDTGYQRQGWDTDASGHPGLNDGLLRRIRSGTGFDARIDDAMSTTGQRSLASARKQLDAVVKEANVAKVEAETTMQKLKDELSKKTDHKTGDLEKSLDRAAETFVKAQKAAEHAERQGKAATKLKEEFDKIGSAEPQVKAGMAVQVTKAQEDFLKAQREAASASQEAREAFYKANNALSDARGIAVGEYSKILGQLAKASHDYNAADAKGRDAAEKAVGADAAKKAYVEAVQKAFTAQDLLQDMDVLQQQFEHIDEGLADAKAAIEDSFDKTVLGFYVNGKIDALRADICNLVKAGQCEKVEASKKGAAAAGSIQRKSSGGAR